MRLIFGFWFAIATTCFGGESQIAEVTPVSNTARPTWSATFENDYTFGSRFNDFGSFGSQAEYHYSIQANHRLDLGENWFIRLGFTEEQFQFSRSNSFLPYSLTKVAGRLGIGSSLSHNFKWELDVEPGIHFTRDHITSNSFDARTVLSGRWEVNPDFTLIFGVAGSLLNENHVLPVGGFIWQVNDCLELNATFPKPRLIYDIAPGTNVYVGGDFFGRRISQRPDR
jgi:hypothetical protein